VRLNRDGAVARFLRRPFVYYYVGIVWVLINGLPWGDWHGAMSVDWMLLSGFSTLILALVLAGTSRPRVERMLDRLDRRGVLILPGIDKKYISAAASLSPFYRGFQPSGRFACSKRPGQLPPVFTSGGLLPMERWVGTWNGRMLSFDPFPGI
jgi:hypothetical protein